jgi:hypothetical protein
MLFAENRPAGKRFFLFREKMANFPSANDNLRTGFTNADEERKNLPAAA